MKLSHWTILAPISGRDTTLAIQPLTGEAVLLEAAEAAALSAGTPGALSTGIDEGGLREMGILVDSDAEDARMLADAKAAFAVEMESTPTQLIAVPSFACNLACTYCYQEVFASTRGLVKPAVIDAFFSWIDRDGNPERVRSALGPYPPPSSPLASLGLAMPSRDAPLPTKPAGSARDRHYATEQPPPYITLFGGEPLVDTPAHRDRVRRYLEGARARGLGVAVVTNGYDLEVFADLLGQGPLREVQVTLDGPRAVHDARRPHGNGGATFERIVRGIDAMVAAKIPVNLRIVVDRANLPSLPELARFAEDKGWLDLPEARFKTQVGRNYELFGCAAGQRRSDLYERAELWAAYVELAEREPGLRRLYRPRFHGIGHLADSGELPAPNFDGCPATKKEWAFGPDGTLYGCTATVGNPRYRLGRFYPTIERDEQAIATWRERSTFNIEECKQCNLAPLCGGGCGALAAASHGSPMKPDCRPVRELVGLGARFYGLDKVDEAPACACAQPASTRARHEPATARSGCLGCGAGLVYLLKAEAMVCAGCGATHPSRACCERGHYYCDRCHAGSAVDAIEQVCLASDEHDPLTLALAAMRRPKVKMHGPEHHYLAPAVLVSAWCNLRGEGQRKATLLSEVRRRSEPVLGGFCGFQGTCGAAIGAGIFVSLVTGANPLSAGPRGLSLRATSEALKVIGKMDAPRCCKRDTFLALLSAARFARQHLDVDFPTHPVRCEFCDMNRECIDDACPFHREEAAIRTIRLPSGTIA